MSVALALMSSAPRIGGRPRWRWVAIVSLSLLIHVVALDALPQWTLEPAERDSSSPPLRAILLPPAAPPQPAASPPPAPRPSSALPSARPSRAASHAPRTPRLSQLPQFVPESLADAVPEVELSLNPAATTTTRSPASAGDGASAAQAAAGDAPEKSTTTSTPSPNALAPASARLDYTVVAVERKHANPVYYYGLGSIDWASGDGRYSSDLKAAVDFLLFKVNVLASHSEGAVTAAGLAPDRYTETPRKRSTVATSFNRDARQSISFSASAATLPLPAGAQDRLSVLFQIGALLRANPDLAVAGGHIDVPVAGVRGELETWVFTTEGIETIDVGPGPLSTAHLRRVPEPGSNDKIIDIWIALADGGYPARVLYTEPNGSTIEMTLDKIEAAR